MFSGAKESRPDGSDWAAEDDGRLFVRQVLHVDQHNHRSKVIRQLRERRFNIGFCGGTGRCRERGRALIHRKIGKGLRRVVEHHDVCFTPLPAVPVDEHGVCDGEQPRAAIGSRREAVEALKRPEEGVLRKVARVGFVACQALRDMINGFQVRQRFAVEAGAAVLSHTIPKRRALPTAPTLHQKRRAPATGTFRDAAVFTLEMRFGRGETAQSHQDLEEKMGRSSVLLLLAYGLSVLPASGQTRFDVGLLLGSTATSDEGTVLQLDRGTTYQATFAWRVWQRGSTRLSVEVPFIASPAFEVTTAGRALPKEYASLYLTPGLRVTLLSERVVSVFAAAGAGYARYSESKLRLDGSPNPAQRDTNTNAFQFGGGVDVRALRWLGFRGELRDLCTGARTFSISTPGNRVHNVVASGGFVLRF